MISVCCRPRISAFFSSGKSSKIHDPRNASASLNHRLQQRGPSAGRGNEVQHDAALRRSRGAHRRRVAFPRSEHERAPHNTRSGLSERTTEHGASHVHPETRQSRRGGLTGYSAHSRPRDRHTTTCECFTPRMRVSRARLRSESSSSCSAQTPTCSDPIRAGGTRASSRSGTGARRRTGWRLRNSFFLAVVDAAMDHHSNESWVFPKTIRHDLSVTQERPFTPLPKKYHP